MTQTADPVLAAILAYARARWCWDDESMLTELYEREGIDSTPEAAVDGWAYRYDLTDPGNLWGAQ